jgi:hypothetical protein
MLLLSAICVAVGPDRAAFLPCNFIKSRPVGKAHMHSLRCTTLPVSSAVATAACVLTICPCLCGVSIGVHCSMHPRNMYYVCVDGAGIRLLCLQHTPATRVSMRQPAAACETAPARHCCHLLMR